jgi:hypothetical protein
MVKRQGMPLVVTDGQGRDPVIVLPLDMYEVLVAGQKPENGQRADSEGIGEPIIVPVRDEVSQPMPAASERPSSNSGSPEKGASQTPEFEPDLISELSTEERFYIDTSEDRKLR